MENPAFPQAGGDCQWAGVHFWHDFGHDARHEARHDSRHDTWHDLRRDLTRRRTGGRRTGAGPRGTVERSWATAESRDRSAFADTPAEDVVYTLPQTREKISGRERYVRFDREYPGDRHVRAERIVAEPDRVVTWLLVTAGGEEMHAVSFFTGDGHGRRTAADTDFRPEPYEPPAGREHLAGRY